MTANDAHILTVIACNTPPTFIRDMFSKPGRFGPGFAAFMFDVVSSGFIAGKSKTSLMSV
jgi:hypothetical protein